MYCECTVWWVYCECTVWWVYCECTVSVQCGGCTVSVQCGGCTVSVQCGGCTVSVQCGGCTVSVQCGGCTVSVQCGGCTVSVQCGGCTVSVQCGGCPVSVQCGGCTVSVQCGGCALRCIWHSLVVLLCSGAIRVSWTWQICMATAVPLLNGFVVFVFWCVSLTCARTCVSCMCVCVCVCVCVCGVCVCVSCMCVSVCVCFCVCGVCVCVCVCVYNGAGATMLASSLKENKPMATSLSTLDLSGNMLGPDVQAALSFLAEPNAVATLKLARCSITFDLVGCLLTHMHTCPYTSVFTVSYLPPPLSPPSCSLLCAEAAASLC